MTSYDAWDFARKRMLILEGLGLSDEYLRRDIKEISGGESIKIALAGILLTSPNFILLDEPTNNLDPKSVKFLEDWIKETQTSLFLISHDREFLDKTVDEIIEIEEATQKMKLFGGNYSFYQDKKEEMFHAQVRQYEEQTRKRKQLEHESTRLKQEASRFEGISTDSFYRAKGGGLAKRAKVQLDRIQRDLSSIPVPVLPKKSNFSVKEPEISNGILISAKNIALGYEDTNPLMSDINFSIHAGERLGIVGPNGIGKTTFLKTIIEEREPRSGKIESKDKLKIGYLSQTQILSDKKQNVLEYVRSKIGVTIDEASKLTSQTLFENISHKKVGDFSFGEFRRIELMILFASNPDLIVLDEPTNHLDLPTLEMLEQVLEKYSGAIISISHDLRFLKNIRLNKLLVFSDNGIKEEQVTGSLIENIFTTL